MPEPQTVTKTRTSSQSDRDLLVALNAHGQVGRAALCRLAIDPSLWSDAEPGDIHLARELGVPLPQLDRALDARDRGDALVAAEQRRAERCDARLITRLDPEYPKALFDHPLPPPVLAVRGELLPASPAVAIVGSRKMNGYGREAAHLFGRELARAGVVVVSGFALGVDQTAHRAAVDAGGRTLAILGCGLDVDYPRRSAPLREKIARGGAIVSEFPLGFEPRAWAFPIRNRVIACLGAATVVIQAKQRSGSLITAHQALELGRDVFAVPGPIFEELCQGTNELIADGAALVSSPMDVLEQLLAGWQGELFPTPEPVSPPEPRGPRPDGLAGRLLDALPRGGDGTTAEELSALTTQPVDRVLGALLELELGGWVERHPGPVYAR